MSLATLTGSTDGGRLLEDVRGMPSPSLQGLYLHWARPDTKKEVQEKDMIEDMSGFRFQRKHFPSDSRQDCKFMLSMFCSSVLLPTLQMISIAYFGNISVRCRLVLLGIGGL